MKRGTKIEGGNPSPPVRRRGRAGKGFSRFGDGGTSGALIVTARFFGKVLHPPPGKCKILSDSVRCAIEFELKSAVGCGMGATENEKCRFQNGSASPRQVVICVDRRSSVVDALLCDFCVSAVRRFRISASNVKRKGKREKKERDRWGEFAEWRNCGDCDFRGKIREGGWGLVAFGCIRFHQHRPALIGAHRWSIRISAVKNSE
jgi:hypothetical protein